MSLKMPKRCIFLKKSTLFGKKLVTLPPTNKKKKIRDLYKMGQLQERYKNYREPQKFMEAGVYPFFRLQPSQMPGTPRAAARKYSTR